MAVDGRALDYQQFVYLMLNKPEGVVSASTDKRETTVVDLVGDAYPRRELFPAGRLDKTSTGFVLLTDDGGFAHDILAPKRHVSKTYTVTIDTPLTEEMRAGFAAGVTLADGTALSPAEVSALTPDGLTVRVLLRQGVYHQIKRMFGIYGCLLYTSCESECLRLQNISSQRENAAARSLFCFETKLFWALQKPLPKGEP